MTKPIRKVNLPRAARMGVGVGALVVGLAAPGALPAGAGAGDEQVLLDLLNGERVARGLAALQVEPALDAGAQDHAEQMLAGGALFHTGMTTTAPAGWSRLGENVGRASGAAAIHEALMASPSHRANMLEPTFDYVGIGVAGSGSATYASIKFADHPSPSIGVAAVAAPGRSVSADGIVTTTGGSSFHGDLRGVRLAGQVVGLEPTPSGGGYWLVAADGGVFSFGDAPFLGSAGGLALRAPVVDMVPTPSGRGYWLAAADGGVFAYGDAPFLGSAGGRRLRSPIVRMNATADGTGYALYAADGRRRGYGTAHR